MAGTPDVEIAVIGGGLSGVGAGVLLKEAGLHDFVVLERSGDIGGVWRDNTYPGVGVDIPSHVYQFDFYPKTNWSRMFAKGAEVKAYIDEVADHFALRPHIRLNSHVRSRTWNDEQCCWELDVNGSSVTARWVIGAVGSFVMPRKPALAGLEDFGGKLQYSANWDHSYDLTGKRVAVVGTGASAVQIVPEIAPVVSHLTVYQRTPIWVLPKPDPALGPRVDSWLRRFPRFRDGVQAKMSLGTEALFLKAILDYGNPRVRRSVDAVTWLLREVYYRRCVPDPELRRRLTPTYGFACKRPSLSSTYLRAFNRCNVELVTEPIERLTPNGIRTVGGAETQLDAIVLATGFVQAHEPDLYELEPVRGRNGFDLAKFYAENRASSYEGVTQPGLPNHLVIYGPYSGTGATYHTVIQVAMTHAIRLIREAQRLGATKVEVRPEAAERWTALVRDRLSSSLFQRGGCEGANSYYFDRNGDTPVIRPAKTPAAFAAQRTFPFEDYLWTTAADQ